jgi:hypothetical protein
VSASTRAPIRWKSGALAVFAASALLALLETSAAAGSMAQPKFYGAQSQSKHAPKIAVVDETIDVGCVAHEPFLECTGGSVLTLENPTDDAISLEVEVDQYASSLLVDGASYALPAPTADGTVRVEQPVEFAPHQKRVAVTKYRTFTFRGDGYEGDFLMRPGLSARHPLVGSYPGPPTATDLMVAGVYVERFASFGLRKVTLRVPAGWDLGAHDGVDQGVDGSVRTIALVPTVAGAPLLLNARLGYPARTVVRGGPLFGVGYGFESRCAGCESAPRVRFGWETGVGRFFVFGLSGESAGTHREVAAATLDLAIPVFPNVTRWIPSITLGAGVPVRVARTPQVGVRAQASLLWKLGDVSVGVGIESDWFFAQSWHSHTPMVLFGL